MVTITDFNTEVLVQHTPLTEKQAVSILCLIDKRDANKISKILAEEVEFEPNGSYFERLKQHLMLNAI